MPVTRYRSYPISLYRLNMLQDHMLTSHFLCDHHISEPPSVPPLECDPPLEAAPSSRVEISSSIARGSPRSTQSNVRLAAEAMTEYGVGNIAFTWAVGPILRALIAASVSGQDCDDVAGFCYHVGLLEGSRGLLEGSN